MPTAASILETRYQALVAPGNDIEFFRLLTEADERLLFAGRWHWAREPLSLSVVDGVVMLPDAYHSIVGARINGHSVGVNWQESEWFEGGPGEFIPIEGASSFLVDQGIMENRAVSIMTISGTLTDGSNPVVFPKLLSTDVAGRWTSNGGDAPLSGEWYRFTSSPPDTVAAEKYVDGSGVCGWEGLYVSNPEDAVLAPLGSETGTPIISVEFASSRVFKLTSTNADITTVDVLARYKPAVIDSSDDFALGPLPAALKQMMLSIIFEEANDSGNAEAYRAKAIRDLNEHEAAYRGSAKRVFKPSQYRPARRRSRHNFP